MVPHTPLFHSKQVLSTIPDLGLLRPLSLLPPLWPRLQPGDGDGSVRPGFLSPRRTLLWSLPALAWAPATLMWLLLPAGHLACTWRGGHLSLSPPAHPRPLCCFSAAAQEPNIFQILSSHLGSAFGRAHKSGPEGSSWEKQETLAPACSGGKKDRAHVHYGCSRKLQAGKWCCFEPSGCPSQCPSPTLTAPVQHLKGQHPHGGDPSASLQL